MTAQSGNIPTMNLEQFKHGIATLSPSEQSEVIAFLFHLRHSGDSEYQKRVEARLSDRDSSHWLTPEEFERRRDEGSAGVLHACP